MFDCKKEKNGGFVGKRREFIGNCGEIGYF